MLNKVAICIILSGCLNIVSAEETNPLIPPLTKKINLSLEEAVKRAIENNPEIKKVSYDLAKTDTNQLLNDSKYAWRLSNGYEYQDSNLPFNQLNLFSGTRNKQYKVSGGIEKLFSTGTYFKVEASSTGLDSNRFRDNNPATASFRALAIPTIYTGAVTVTISQDLIKNAFGYQERNLNKILENQSAINKNIITLQLSNLVVTAMTDFWNYSVAQTSVKTFEKLLQNTNNIKNLTIQKQRLGLSESFEVNQWNALHEEAKNQLENAKLQQEQTKRKLIRTLNLPNETDFDENSLSLSESISEGIDFQKDLQYAYKNRLDYKNVLKQKEIAELTLKNAKNNALPSLKATGSVLSQDQVFKPDNPEYNFSLDNPHGAISANGYKTYSGSLKLTYPISDNGVAAQKRDADIGMKQLTISEEDLKKEVYDDVKIKIDTLQASQRILQNSVETEKESQRYYNGVLVSFRQGRVNAISVKNALDGLVQDQLQLVQAKVNFNINLMRYYLAKNYLFEKFGLNVDKLIPEIQ